VAAKAVLDLYKRKYARGGSGRVPGTVPTQTMGLCRDLVDAIAVPFFRNDAEAKAPLQHAV
jgi:hypothetical protein